MAIVASEGTFQNIWYSLANIAPPSRNATRVDFAIIRSSHVIPGMNAPSRSEIDHHHKRSAAARARDVCGVTGWMQSNRNLIDNRANVVGTDPDANDPTIGNVASKLRRA